MRIRWLLLPASLLITSSVLCQPKSMRSIQDYRTGIYRLLAVDTLGKGRLDTTTINSFIFRSVGQLPIHAFGLEKVIRITTVKSTEAYHVDSNMYQVASIQFVRGDSLIPVKLIPPDQWIDNFDEPRIDSNDYIPQTGSYFADSLWLYPIPTRGLTVRVMYYQQPSFAGTTDSLSVKQGYEMGITLYAIWLAEKRQRMGRDELAWKDYERWAAVFNVNANRKLTDKPRGE